MFVSELIVGYWTRSIALVTDSFHMLSDILALSIASYAITLSTKSSSNQHTFGWQRAEIIGALINATFLLALCFTIIISSIQRFIEPVVVNSPVIVFIVGWIGLAINCLGLALFHDHSSVTPVPPVSSSSQITIPAHQIISVENEINDMQILSEEDNIPRPQISLAPIQTTPQQQLHTKLNIHGVWLHVLGDALGSIGVIISAAVIQWTNWSLKNYMDPFVSLLIAVLIICTTVPLFKKSANIVLHIVPPYIHIDDIRQDIQNLPDVEDIHEFHVWQLSDLKTIASIHVKLKANGNSNNMKIISDIKQLLHNHSIHSTTIQLETPGLQTPSQTSTQEQDCLITCDDVCNPQKCC